VNILVAGDGLLTGEYWCFGGHSAQFMSDALLYKEGGAGFDKRNSSTGVHRAVKVVGLVTGKLQAIRSICWGKGSER